MSSVAGEGTKRDAKRITERYRVINKSKKSVVAERLGIANTPKLRSKGLLGRSGLEHGEGLWITPCESVHTFWMRFAIDLIYVDRVHRVKKVRKCVAPWRLSACLTAHSILELPCGTIDESRTERGDLLEMLPIEDEI